MWKKSDSSREAQQERRKKAYEKLLELYRGKLEQRDGLAIAPFYDAEGSPDNSSRAPMWLAELFLEGDEKDWEIANDMIEGTRFGHACIFTGVACAEYGWKGIFFIALPTGCPEMWRLLGRMTISPLDAAQRSVSAANISVIPP